MLGFSEVVLQQLKISKIHKGTIFLLAFQVQI